MGTRAVGGGTPERRAFCKGEEGCVGGGGGGAEVYISPPPAPPHGHELGEAVKDLDDAQDGAEGAEVLRRGCGGGDGRGFSPRESPSPSSPPLTEGQRALGSGDLASGRRRAVGRRAQDGVGELGDRERRRGVVRLEGEVGVRSERSCSRGAAACLLGGARAPPTSLPPPSYHEARLSCKCASCGPRGAARPRQLRTAPRRQRRRHQAPLRLRQTARCLPRGTYAVPFAGVGENHPTGGEGGGTRQARDVARELTGP